MCRWARARFWELSLIKKKNERQSERFLIDFYDASFSLPDGNNAYVLDPPTAMRNTHHGWTEKSIFKTSVQILT